MGQTTDLWWGGCKAIAIKTSSSRALGRSGKCSSAVLLFGHSAVLQVFSCVFAHIIDIMFFGLASRSSLSLCLTLSWTLLCTERNFWVGHYYAHIRAVNVWVWLRPFSSKLFANMVENSKPSISFRVSSVFVHLHDGQFAVGAARSGTAKGSCNSQASFAPIRLSSRKITQQGLLLDMCIEQTITQTGTGSGFAQRSA